MVPKTLTRHLSLNGGMTKIANAFFKGGRILLSREAMAGA
jgi:hypothetical protein